MFKYSLDLCTNVTNGQELSHLDCLWQVGNADPDSFSLTETMAGEGMSEAGTEMSEVDEEMGETGTEMSEVGAEISEVGVDEEVCDAQPLPRSPLCIAILIFDTLSLRRSVIH